MAEPRVIRVLQNANDVVRALVHEGAMTPAELAETVAMPRSSVYRLVDGLAAIGLVEVLSDSRAMLSEQWLHLADTAADRIEWRHAGPVLDRLRDTTGETAYLSVPYGGEAICLHWRQGRGIELMMLRPGRAMPLHASAAGRVMLAFGDIDSARVTTGALHAFTEHTIIEPAALERDAAEVRRRGYAVSEEDVTIGVGAIGVPVRDPSGALAAVVSVGGLVDEMRRRRDELVHAVEEAARELQASA